MVKNIKQSENYIFNYKPLAKQKKTRSF
jgi:hypothetical protein